MAKVDKPRPRMTPLAFFVQACRAEIRRRHPEARVSVAVLSRACSERWRTTSARERALFKHLAREDKQRFDREWGVSAQQPPKSRSRKDPHAPKKPLTAFFLFASAHRPQIRAHWPGLSVPEQAKKLGQKWSEQTAEERRPFEIRAAELKEQYDADVAVYQGRGIARAIGKGEDVKQELEAHLSRGPEGEEGEETHEIFAQYSVGLLEEEENTHGLEPPLGVAPLQSQGEKTSNTNLATHHNVKSEERQERRIEEEVNRKEMSLVEKMKEQAKPGIQTRVGEISGEPGEEEGFEEESEEEDGMEVYIRKGKKEVAGAAMVEKPVNEDDDPEDEEYDEDSLGGKGS